MKSIFRYPGGKSKPMARDKILEFMPSYIREYREPFVGGGSIFFAIDKIQNRWVNDLDPYLINVYSALRDRPDEFINSCRIIEPMKIDEEVYSPSPNSQAKYNKRLKLWFDFFCNSKCCDPALKYFFINRTVWIGRVRYGWKSKLYYSLPEGWNIVSKSIMEEAAEHLKNVKITCDDYEKSLLEPSVDENIWIYCDPPYYCNSLETDSQRMYDKNFEVYDHERFANIALKSPHRICISYDDHPEIHKLYSNSKFKIQKTSWSYVGTSSAKSTAQNSSNRNNITNVVHKNVGKELIITNY